MIKQTLQDMFTFTFIMLLIIFLMAVVNCVHDIDGSPRNDHVWSGLPKYVSEYYLVMFGENPNPKKISNIQWIMYIVFSFLVNIISLNLLIAILSNTYDQVMTSIDAAHFKTKVDILDEIQDLFIWNRGYNELNYLHFTYYAFEDIQQGDGFEGRVRVLLN